MDNHPEKEQHDREMDSPVGIVMYEQDKLTDRIPKMNWPQEYIAFAKEEAEKSPDQYAYFMGLCRKYGSSGALSMCSGSDAETMPVLIFWAKQFEEESQRTA